MIEEIAWAVQPNSTGLTRPDRLVRELVELKAISPDAVRLYHGKSAAAPRTKQAPKLWPASGVNRNRPTAVLSPLFLLSISQNIAWIDLYDDWSLAPDINRLYRSYAKLGYLRLRQGRERHQLLTTNTQYLAKKINPRQATVVPNGVDDQLASLSRTDDDASQLIILGNFFQGRTDFDLMERLSTSPRFDFVHIGGPGNDPQMRTFLNSVQSAHPGRLVIHPRIDDRQLALLAGPNTAALIPNLVSPYTLSQDPMKAYTFGAVGIPTISRSEIWPTILPRSRNLLITPGDDIDSRLSSWHPERASDEERLEFARTHSWRKRAEYISEHLN